MEQPLTLADIERLGKLAGMHVSALPEDFNGSSSEGQVALEGIILSLEHEAIALTNVRESVPSEVENDQV